MIYFSDWGAALLGLTKNNIDLGKEKQLLEPCVDVEQVISGSKKHVRKNLKSLWMWNCIGRMEVLFMNYV